MRLYVKFLGLHLKAALQYKLSFALSVLSQILVSFNTLLGILFIFNRFHRIKTYSLSEVLLCFSIILMPYALAEVIMRGFDTFASTIGNGEFDRILLRPRGVLLQVVCNKVGLNRFGRLPQAVLMLAYGIAKSGIVWDRLKIIALILMIFGGFIVFCCIFVIYASLCFFTLEGLEFVNVLTDGAKEHGKYPLDVYGRRVVKFCTYIVPYSLFQYYPFLYLTGRTDTAWYVFLPLLTSGFIVPCLLLWRYGLRHYKSTGS
ncbi:MAG: hypothetical protein GX757_10275 [Clostridiales bacterium]|nr:hypothetical protein [Clostridiales bacterium]